MMFMYSSSVNSFVHNRGLANCYCSLRFVNFFTPNVVVAVTGLPLAPAKLRMLRRCDLVKNIYYDAS